MLGLWGYAGQRRGACTLNKLVLTGVMLGCLAFSAPWGVAQPAFELGDPELLMAAQEGMETLVERRLRNGAAVDSRDALGRTPLMAAARNNHERLVTLLLRHGADAELEDGRGHTAVSWAIMRGHLMVAHTLLTALQGSPAFERQVYLALEAAREKGDHKTAQALRAMYGEGEGPSEAGVEQDVPDATPDADLEADEEPVDPPGSEPRPPWPRATRAPGPP
jgi:hypothetical protein